MEPLPCVSNLYWKTLSTRHMFVSCRIFRSRNFYFYCLFRCLRQALPLDFRLTSIIHTIAIIIFRSIFFFLLSFVAGNISNQSLLSKPILRARHHGTLLSMFTAELITSIDWAKFNHGSDKIRHTRAASWKIATEILFRGNFVAVGMGREKGQHFIGSNGECDGYSAYLTARKI